MSNSIEEDPPEEIRIIDLTFADLARNVRGKGLDGQVDALNGLLETMFGHDKRAPKRENIARAQGIADAALTKKRGSGRQ